MRGGIALGLALATWLGAPSARGESNQFVLEWRPAAGAEACPSEAALRAEVAARLGRDPFVQQAARSIQASIAREGELWRGQISVRDAERTGVGARSLESAAADCRALFDAMVLAIALVVDPNASPMPPAAGASGRGAEPECGGAGPCSTPQQTWPAAPAQASAPAAPSTPAQSHSPLSSPPSRADASPSASSNLRSLESFTNARAVLGLGLLPEPRLGASVMSGVHHRSGFGFGFGMLLLPSVRTTAPSVRGEFGVGLTSALLEGSFGVATDVTYAGVTAGIAAGALHTVVYSPTPTEPGDLFWAAATAGVSARMRWAGPLVAELGVTAIVPLTRYELAVSGREPAFSAPFLGALGHFGVGAHFR